MESPIVNISVRNLVEFVLRSGNIDSTYISSKRANEGTLIHQKVQKMRKKESKLKNIIYESEFSLKESFEYKEFLFNIEGRADGIFIDEKKVTIEEIKSTYRDLKTIEVDKTSWHLAQAKCYAFIYAKQKLLDNIKVMLTYFNIESEEMLIFEEEFSILELQNFFHELLEKYYLFAKFDFKRINDRNKTVLNLNFPYENYRKGQRELAVAVFKTIQLGKKLFAQAPTGTGKTISTIFPVIKAMPALGIEKFFYLTAKTITRQVAEDAFFLMKSKGLVMRVVTLTAKDKICFLDKPSCNPIDCEYANGHFDRINPALLDILNNETIITRETIIKYSKKHSVCPLEFGLDITNFCDCIICDYNYVYDPKVFLKRYFSNGMKNNFVIINDESHNLVDRAREMYSATLNNTDFTNILKILSKESRLLKNSIKKISTNILTFADSIAQGEVKIFEENSQEFIFVLYDFAKRADEWLAENQNTLEQEKILDLYFKVLDFLKISEFFDERYIFYVERSWSDVTIKLLCLDVSYLLNEVSKKVTSSIFFSATLSPINYFKSVLGGNLDEDFHIILSSPFPENNFSLIIDKSISTKFIHRKFSYPKISERIFNFISKKNGNYMIFFPSYDYMEKVYDIFSKEYSFIDTIVQGKNLTETEKEQFLARFDSTNKESLVAFVVLGGIFSEGIDLVGERLIGVCVVSVGLPLISKERNIIRDYYDKIIGQGFDYAYKFPGINKVLQASGRLIRSETDRGIILLIDTRFSTNEYKNLFPIEWQNHKIINSNSELLNILDDFWNI